MALLSVIILYTHHYRVQMNKIYQIQRKLNDKLRSLFRNILILRVINDDNRKIDEYFDDLDKLKDSIEKRKKIVNLDAELDKINLLDSALDEIQIRKMKGESGRKIESELDSLTKYFESKNRIIRRELKKRNELVAKSNKLLDIIERLTIIRNKKIDRFQLLGSVLILIVVFTYSIINDHFNPKLGWNINIDYYITVATIIPVFFIAAYIESGYFNKQNNTNRSKFSDAFSLVVPVVIVEYSCLLAIAYKKSTTFLYIVTLLLLFNTITNLVLLVYYSNERQHSNINK